MTRIKRCLRSKLRHQTSYLTKTMILRVKMSFRNSFQRLLLLERRSKDPRQWPRTKLKLQNHGNWYIEMASLFRRSLQINLGRQIEYKVVRELHLRNHKCPKIKSIKSPLVSPTPSKCLAKTRWMEGTPVCDHRRKTKWKTRLVLPSPRVSLS